MQALETLTSLYIYKDKTVQRPALTACRWRLAGWRRRGAADAAGAAEVSGAEDAAAAEAAEAAAASESARARFCRLRLPED